MSLEHEEEHGGFYENVFVLMFLYVLQGIPLGISGKFVIFYLIVFTISGFSAAIPTLLLNTSITYHQQAVFSFAFWPFSLKILWAPIVDTRYIKALGLRKTWILFSQLTIGVMMIFLSFHITQMMGKVK